MWLLDTLCGDNKNYIMGEEGNSDQRNRHQTQLGSVHNSCWRPPGKNRPRLRHGALGLTMASLCLLLFFSTAAAQATPGQAPQKYLQFSNKRSTSGLYNHIYGILVWTNLACVSKNTYQNYNPPERSEGGFKRKRPKSWQWKQKQWKPK